MKKFLSIVSLTALLAAGMIGASGCSTGAGNASPSVSSSTGSVTADIVLGDTISINGSGANIDGSKVIINEPGTYNISGTLDNGMIKVSGDDGNVNLVLAGASISNSDGPAILIDKTELATITLKDGTANSLSDGGSSDYDAALYCDGSLTINGAGSLDVEANNNEGISSTMNINIESGEIRVVAVEDGFNANNDGVSEINISGGYVYIETETGDGIDSNGNINISGGTVISLGALVDANGGLDAGGKVTITGGTVIATGSQISAPGSDSAQKAILASFSGTQAAGTLVGVQANGETVLAFAPARDFQRLLWSSPEIAEGVSYDIYTGGNASGESVDGLYGSSAYTPGTLASTITTESASNASTMGPQGGPRGMMPQGTDQSTAQDSNQGVPADMSQGSPPDLSQGTPPDMSQGTPPDMSQGTPPDMSQGTPPDMSQGTPPDMSQGTPPAQ